VLRAVGSFIPFGKREHLIQAKVIWGPVDPEDHQVIFAFIVDSIE